MEEKTEPASTGAAGARVRSWFYSGTALVLNAEVNTVRRAPSRNRCFNDGTQPTNTRTKPLALQRLNGHRLLHLSAQTLSAWNSPHHLTNLSNATERPGLKPCTLSGSFPQESVPSTNRVDSQARKGLAIVPKEKGENMAKRFFVPSVEWACFFCGDFSSQTVELVARVLCSETGWLAVWMLSRAKRGGSLEGRGTATGAHNITDHIFDTQNYREKKIKKDQV